MRACIMLGLATILALGCSEMGGVGSEPIDTSSQNTPGFNVPAVTDIAIRPPASPLVLTGSELALQATHDSGGTQTVASRVEWISSAPNVATVDRMTGVVQAISEGDVYIRAIMGQSLRDSVALRVIWKGLFAIAPIAPSVQVGETVQLSAATSASVSWTSSNPAIAVVSRTGIVTGVRMGSAVVSARTAQGSTAAAIVTVKKGAKPVPPAPSPEVVSLTINPRAITLVPGATQQYSTMGTWSDGSVTPPAVSYAASGGTVTTTGLYTAGSTPGQYRVIATSQNGKKADTSTVTIAPVAAVLLTLVLSPATATVTSGATQQFAVAGNWSDGSAAVPTVSYSITGGTITTTGLYTAGSATGTFRVIATHVQSGRADTSAIVVPAPVTLTALAISPKQVTLSTSATQQFSTSATWSNGSTTAPTVTYSATGGTITTGGLYSAGTQPGTFRVIATAPGKADTSVITVNAPAPTLTRLAISPKTLSIASGATQQFSASATWSNGATTVPALTYGATGGTITGGGFYTAASTPGTYRVTVVGGGKADTTNVVVTAPSNLRALVDREFYSKSTYGAYAQPWSTFFDSTLRQNIDYSDTIVVDVNAFPGSSTIKWHWPSRTPSTSGVWGYMHVFFGNFDGGQTAVTVPSTRAKDINTLRQDFSASYTSAGSFNILNEFYLTSAAGNSDAKVIEIGYLLHASSDGRQYFQSAPLVGSYQDSYGRTWELRMTGTYCMIMLAGGGDVLSGTIDVKSTIDFLIGKGTISGNEWFNGIGIGIEPVSGSGELKLKQWLITYH